MNIKKYLAMALLPLFWSSPVQGQREICRDVCADTEVNNYYRFVSIINNTDIYLKCQVLASNGAEHYFYVRPRTVSRLYTINDPRAAWSWSCDDYRKT